MVFEAANLRLKPSEVGFELRMEVRRANPMGKGLVRREESRGLWEKGVGARASLGLGSAWR